MEARGSCLLFGRSLDKHKLRYIPFVGDGDSKSYTEVCKLAPYGPAVLQRVAMRCFSREILIYFQRR